jgi:hypothetical protein
VTNAFDGTGPARQGGIGVGVGVGVSVEVGAGVSVGTGEGVMVAVGESVGVFVGTGVAVGCSGVAIGASVSAEAQPDSRVNNSRQMMGNAFRKWGNEPNSFLDMIFSFEKEISSFVGPGS